MYSRTTLLMKRRILKKEGVIESYGRDAMDLDALVRVGRMLLRIPLFEPLSLPKLLQPACQDRVGRILGVQTHLGYTEEVLQATSTHLAYR